MKLKEFVANLQQLLESDPSSGELDVVTSVDSGVEYHTRVQYVPEVGHYTGDNTGDFTSIEDIIDDPPSYTEFKGKQPNAVCVN